MDPRICLDDLPVGAAGKIVSVAADTSMERRLNELGFSEGGIAVCVMRNRAGDLSAYRISGTVIALRRRDAHAIRVLPLREDGT